MVPAVTVIDPRWVAVTVGCVTATVMPLSDCGVPNVTVAVPDVIFGCRITFFPAATMVVSGLKSHSAPGNVMLPLATSRVAL